MKPFSPDELAFFVVPRVWPDIVARFGGKYTEELRDRVIAADDVPPPNGGAGFLHWTQATKTWTLTRFGRVYVLERGMPGILEMNEAWRPPRPTTPDRSESGKDKAEP